MRKVTRDIANAFYKGEAKKISNTTTDGESIWLFGNMIAKKLHGSLWITNAGWQSNTTKERLNGLEGVSIQTIKGAWFLNGKQWSGGWVEVLKLEPMEVEYDLSCMWSNDHDVPVFSVFHSIDKKLALNVIGNLIWHYIESRLMETDTHGVYRPNYFVVVRPCDLVVARKVVSMKTQP
jgi:hypothetical protein